MYSYGILITSQIVDVQSLTEAGFYLNLHFYRKSRVMHMALVCYISFSRIGILTADQERAGNRSEPWEQIYVIKAIETWSLVNQSQEYSTYITQISQFVYIYLSHQHHFLLL